MLQIILLTHILWSCSEFNLTAPLCTVFISCLPSFGCMNWERKTRQWKMIYAAKPNKFNWLLYRNVSKLNILSIHEGILCWFTRNDDYFNQNFTSRFECEYQKTMNMLKKLWKCGFQNGCENNPQLAEVGFSIIFTNAWLPKKTPLNFHRMFVRHRICFKLLSIFEHFTDGKFSIHLPASRYGFIPTETPELGELNVLCLIGDNIFGIVWSYLTNLFTLNIIDMYAVRFAWIWPYPLHNGQYIHLLLWIASFVVCYYLGAAHVAHWFINWFRNTNNRRND